VLEEELLSGVVELGVVELELLLGVEVGVDDEVSVELVDPAAEPLAFMLPEVVLELLGVVVELLGDEVLMEVSLEAGTAVLCRVDLLQPAKQRANAVRPAAPVNLSV
jgi:hypothetical protein